MKKVLALVLVMMLALSVAAFAEKAGEGITIGVVYKQSGNAYFQAGVEGFQKAADELGFEFMHDGPDDGSSDGQIRIIENYIAQGVDALCISANDPAGGRLQRGPRGRHQGPVLGRQGGRRRPRPGR